MPRPSVERFGDNPRSDPPFHVDDGGHDFLAGSFWARFRRRLGREQPAILPLCQRSMKAQERGGFQDDRGTGHTAWAHEERTHTGDDAICDAEIWVNVSGTD